MPHPLFLLPHPFSHLLDFLLQEIAQPLGLPFILLLDCLFMSMIYYFLLWIPMARSIPNSNNLSEIAMHQATNMNFSNIQHIPLSDPTTPSVSEDQPDFKLPAPFGYIMRFFTSYARNSSPGTR